jgi:hypothetical protein
MRVVLDHHNPLRFPSRHLTRCLTGCRPAVELREASATPRRNSPALKVGASTVSVGRGYQERSARFHAAACE